MLKSVPGESLATVAERAVPFYRPPAAVAKIAKAEITLALPGRQYLSVILVECRPKMAAWIAANGVRGDAC